MTAEKGFLDCVAFVIDVLEGGGKLNIDSGGKTRYGIAQKSHPLVNIDTLSREEAENIYHTQYWEPAGCELLSWPFNLIVFDTAVNEGVAKAVKMRLSAYNWASMLMERVEHYAYLADRQPEKQQYFRGWIHRLVVLYERARQI